MPAVPVPDAVRDGNGASRSKRAKAIISFASNLCARLPNERNDAKLLDDIQAQVRALDGYKNTTKDCMLGDEDVEHQGTKLWNLCTRLNRETATNSESTTKSKLVLWGRVLAYYMLHLCQWSARSPPHSVSHLMKLALKVAKCCTDDHDVHTARGILQRAADYDGQLQKLSQTLEQGHAEAITDLQAEWTVLRVVLAWQDNQLEIAEHSFAQAEDLLKRIKPRSAEKIADGLYHIGKGLLLKEDYRMAEKWLQRCWDIINSQQLQDMSRDSVELRIAILQALVTALMGLQTNESVKQAHNLVKYVETEIGDQPVVLLLNLEIINKSPAEVFDADAFADILRRMIRSFRPTEANFNLLSYHIRMLHTKSPVLGCSTLDNFLVTLLKKSLDGAYGGDGDPLFVKWIDKLVVNRIYMATSHRDFEGTIESAQGAISRLEKPVGADASFAAQTLIWKKVESNYSQSQFEIAEMWCKLALNPAFANSGPLNRGKFERKVLLCALARNDLDTAKSTFFDMTTETQKDPMTQYLMYKASIRSGDQEMASKSLEGVAVAGVRIELLYACVADSQHCGDRLVMLEAMKKLAEAYNYERPGPVHLPALLRCTIMLLHSFLNSDENIDHDPVIADICSVFDGVVEAVRQAPRDIQGNKLFDVKELEWFCQNSYNLGLKHAGDWHLRSVVQVLTACVKLLSSFPDDIPAEIAVDLSFRSIFCNFLIASALVALARAQDDLEQHLQDYLVMRTHIMAADKEIQERLQSRTLDNVSTADLLNKLALLLAFDFEAAAALKKYQDLSEIVLKAVPCRNMACFKAMADCALRYHLPPEELFSILRKIINQISELEDSNTAKLAKYTRCLFQATLPFKEELGARLLDEACRMAGEAHGTPAAWPREEVEWLASVAYNHSIDLCGRGETESCRWWAEKALSLAHFCDDGKQLETLLQDKYLKLKLDAEQ